MNSLRALVLLEHSETFDEHFIESENWLIPQEGLQRVRCMTGAGAEELSNYVVHLNKHGIDTYIVSSEEQRNLLDVKGNFRTLNLEFDRPFIELHLAGPVEIYESYLSIFSSEFKRIDWSLYAKIYSDIEGFVKSRIIKRISELNETDKAEYQPFLSKINYDDFILELDKKTFHHLAIPFFKIQPETNLFELPLPDSGEVQRNINSALMKKLSVYARPNKLEQVFDGLAQVARQGVAKVTTMVSANNLEPLRRNLLGAQLSFANQSQSEKIGESDLFGIFPIQWKLLSDKSRLFITLMAVNLKEITVDGLSVSAHSEGDALECKLLSLKSRSQKIQVEIGLPEQLTELPSQCVCIFDAEGSSLSLALDFER